METERVLVFPAHLLKGHDFSKHIITDGRIAHKALEQFLAAAFFMDRPEAEQNPDFKQLIPYCVLVTHESGYPKYFTYQRSKKGSEDRLHDKWSLGVGGHVNPVDGTGSTLAYQLGFFRELHEEVGMLFADGSTPINSVRGLIYDDTDAVGRVHVGVVHFLPVMDEFSLRYEENLANPTWHGHYTLTDPKVAATFESWSQLVLTHIIR